MTAQYVTCHYIKPRAGIQCTAEVVDEHGELLLCPQHLALAMEMVKRQMTAAEKVRSTA